MGVEGYRKGQREMGVEGYGAERDGSGGTGGGAAVSQGRELVEAQGRGLPLKR